MGKEHKKHKKHKHSSKQHKHKPNKDGEYHVPIVPLKSDMRMKPVPPSSIVPKPIGPVLPSELSSNPDGIGKTNTDGPSDDKQNDSYGPSLPPHLVQQKRVPGPSLPLDFKTKTTVQPQDDDITGFGPLPAELIKSDSEQLFVQKQLELRAEYMKRKFAGEVSLYSHRNLYSY